jgi:hypothetical protein
MLSTTIPSYKPDDKKSKEPEETITVGELSNLI